MRCRFCRRSADQPSSTINFRGAATCSDAGRWLPQFADLLDAMPPGQLKHMLLTAEAAQTKEMKSIPAIDSMIGYQLPPEPKVKELLKLVFIHTVDTPAFAHLEGHSRLELVGVTRESINSERELIKQEAQSGERCLSCGEYIVSDSAKCRICGASRQGDVTVVADAPPRPDVDEPFLRWIVIHVAASERLDPCDVPFVAETLAALGITDSEIAVEEGRLSSSFSPSYAQELPLSTWENSLIANGHTHERTQYAAVRNLIELAKSCRLNGRLHEAHLLMKFTESVIARPETDEFLRDFMLADFRLEKRRLSRVGDIAGGAAQSDAGMFLEGETAAERSSSLVDINLSGIMRGSPEDRLKEIERARESLGRAVDEMLQNKGKSEDDLSVSILRNAREVLGSQSQSIIARGELEQGNFAVAETIVHQALASLSADASVILQQRAEQLCLLAEIYAAQERTDEAIESLHAAAAQAQSMTQTERYGRGMALRKVAAAFEKLAQLDRAKEFYELAIAEGELGISSFLGLGVPLQTGLIQILSDMVTSYAGVLRKLGLEEQAEDAERKARSLRTKGGATP
jgi:tetratricopeptide (TPR) repeat protein